MADEIAIKVENVNKTFRLPHEKSGSIKNAVVNFASRKKGYELQRALKNVSFEVKKGEFFGIVGRNGSGKSTLLKLLAGIYTPNSGNIQINGKLTPFIELGVGFSPELTGRENVYLNGALLGFNRKEMNAMYEEIVEFAELKRFMDQKLKNYSSGMQVRLAFSIAIRANTDILVLDEVLAVGDTIFQKKCYDYFKQLKKQQKTVIFVSHDISALQEYCDKGVLIETGNLLHEGSIEDVINQYLEVVTQREEDSAMDIRPKTKSGKNHIGTGEVKIKNTSVYPAGARGRERSVFTEKEKSIIVDVVYEATRDVDEPIYGITIFDAAGQRIFVTNNLWIQKNTKALKQGQSVRVIWEVPNVFNSGRFGITPAVAGSTGTAIYDQLEDAASFYVRKKNKSNAFLNMEHKMTIDSLH